MKSEVKEISAFPCAFAREKIMDAANHVHINFKFLDVSITFLFVFHRCDRRVSTKFSTFNFQFSVNVLPLSNYYQEPDIYFGESRESVDAKYASEDYNPTTDDVVLYPYKSDVTDYMYVYYEDDKVVAYEILVIADDISLVEEFISERYRYLGEIYGLPVYINTLALSDATMSVSYRHYDSECVIVRYYTYDWVRN